MSLLLVATAAAAPWAAASSPATEVFKSISPAVRTIALLDADGKPGTNRSAVVVGPDSIVTVCEGDDAPRSITLRDQSPNEVLRLLAVDIERKLCLFTAPGVFRDVAFPTPEQALPREGDRIFAISNSLGLGIGITEGIVAGVRRTARGARIQFTAPIAPGAQGGALVNDAGRLLGVIEYEHKAGQNVNFAAPAVWIREIEVRAATQRREARRAQEAGALARARRWKELLDLARQGVNAGPWAIESWEYVALAEKELGNLEAAEQAWRKALELAPERDRSALALGEWLIGQRRPEEALAIVDRTLEVQPENAGLWLLRARGLRATSRMVDAEQAYRRATQIDPWLFPAYLGLAELAQFRGEFLGASAILSRMASLLPDSQDIQYGLIANLLMAKRYDQALRALAELPAALAAAPRAISFNAAAIAGLGRPAEAVTLLQNYVRDNPACGPEIWLRLSSILAEMTRHAEAADAARNAVREAPDNLDARYVFAVRLKDAGHVREAQVIIEKLIDTYGDKAAAWRQKGFIHSILGERKPAVEALEKSLSFDPRQTKTWAALIEVLHADGDRPAVVRAYGKLRELDPAYAESVYRPLGVIYQANQR